MATVQFVGEWYRWNITLAGLAALKEFEDEQQRQYDKRHMDKGKGPLEMRKLAQARLLQYGKKYNEIINEFTKE